MANSSQATNVIQAPQDWVALAHRLGRRFAERAAGHDADDSFVGDNYAELKEAHVFSAGVPAELGGGGASHAELGAMLRTLAQYCSSTALALSMHTHIVATAAWRWRNEGAPVEPLLRRIAAEQLVMISSGGSDWLQGSAKAVPVEGGFRVTGRKIFASGSPAGQIFMTMAVLEEGVDEPTVLHIAVPFNAPGVKVQDNWRTLGMRGTGSNDVILEDVFVPTAAALPMPSSARCCGRWRSIAAPRRWHCRCTRISSPRPPGAGATKAHLWSRSCGASPPSSW